MDAFFGFGGGFDFGAEGFAPTFDFGSDFEGFPGGMEGLFGGGEVGGMSGIGGQEPLIDPSQFMTSPEGPNPTAPPTAGGYGRIAPMMQGNPGVPDPMTDAIRNNMFPGEVPNDTMARIGAQPLGLARPPYPGAQPIPNPGNPTNYSLEDARTGNMDITKSPNYQELNNNSLRDSNPVYNDFHNKLNEIRENQQQPSSNINLSSLADSRDGRIEQIVAASKAAYPNNPALAKLTASQAILESRLLGNPSGLARNNNLFGIKGKGTAGTVNMRTREVYGGKSVYENAGFAKNSTLTDSFKQHRNLLERSRYKNVWNAKSLPEAAQAVRAAGYATDPRYPQKLINIYNKYLSSHF